VMPGHHTWTRSSYVSNRYFSVLRLTFQLLYFGWKMISNGVFLSSDSCFWDHFDDKYSLKLRTLLVRDVILFSPVQRLCYCFVVNNVLSESVNGKHFLSFNHLTCLPPM
jgi:hypothetical protein